MVFKFSYFVEFTKGYQLAKFQCCRLSGSSFTERLQKQNYNIIMVSFHIFGIWNLLFYIPRKLYFHFSFLIRKSRQKAIEIELAFFHSLGNPKGCTLHHYFYALHICDNVLPLQTYTYTDELFEIVLKLAMKMVQVHLIIGRL